MKITVIARTYNEERNLRRFVWAYHDWVDHILIQDDNSDDVGYLGRVQMDFPKVKLSQYHGKRINREGVTRAYQDIQLNQLVDWAECLNSDWIIMDDCDCFPTRHLKNRARKILTRCKKDFIYLTRIYLYKNLEYFPKLSIHNEEWQQGLWAWKARKGFRFINNGYMGQKFERPNVRNILRLSPPVSLLHNPWPNDAVIEFKRERYAAIYGKAYATFDPKTFGGKLKPLEEWMKE